MSAEKSLTSCRRAAHKRAHLIGIAGAGMSALADVLRQQGWSLTGSDLSLGGHSAANVPSETDLVVFSSAISSSNPELLRAAELGIPTQSYAQMLGSLMSGKQGLAIAGTHGKSTATAMAACALVEAGLDPTVILGATPLRASSGGRSGASELVLVEACEFRENFLHLQPQHAVILGIEPDHFDCYPTSESLEDAFARFGALIPARGLLIVRDDCAVSRRIASRMVCRMETFGFDHQANWSAAGLQSHGGRYRFEIIHESRAFAEVSLRLPGRHNVLNALAAAALAHANGAGPEQIAAGLGRFAGLHRRLENLGTWGGIVLIDDYAHHPTEVTASLAAIRVMEPGRRVWCVFQPHQASRTEHLLHELATSLQNADTVLVAEIFRAREGPARPGEVTAADLAREIRLRGTRVPDLHTTEEITRLLTTQLTPGDVLVTMGAGDIGEIAYGLMERFRENRAAG